MSIPPSSSRGRQRTADRISGRYPVTNGRVPPPPSNGKRSAKEYSLTAAEKSRWSHKMNFTSSVTSLPLAIGPLKNHVARFKKVLILGLNQSLFIFIYKRNFYTSYI
ncbi:hypothetical protein CDAR_559831 [Caerostris darwini]|uniref:Uncharacterized protein n=1 Tax=Caerostris darwini TaxID=1538125 RepID=A0AAV4T9R1_9ARAC|nr:hypothetical protein CDAR_559831 [Caerostris darwini]